MQEYNLNGQANGRLIIYLGCNICIKKVVSEVW